MGGTVSPMQSMSRGRCFASCCGVSCEVRSTAVRNAGATFCSCVAVGFGRGAAGGEGTFPSRGSVRASESQDLSFRDGNGPASSTCRRGLADPRGPVACEGLGVNP